MLRKTSLYRVDIEQYRILFMLRCGTSRVCRLYCNRAATRYSKDLRASIYLRYGWAALTSVGEVKQGVPIRNLGVGLFALATVAAAGLFLHGGSKNGPSVFFYRREQVSGKPGQRPIHRRIQVFRVSLRFLAHSEGVSSPPQSRLAWQSLGSLLEKALLPPVTVQIRPPTHEL